MYCRLPNLHTSWPFPKLINPLYSEAALESTQWTNSFQLFTSKQQNKFERINIGLLAGFAYPVHEKGHLKLVCDLMNMLFAVDDISDVLSGRDAEGLSEKILTCFRETQVGKWNTLDEHPLVKMHYDFLKAVTEIAGTNSTHRLLKDYEEYLRATVKEAKDREDRCIRSVEEYLKLRRDTSAVKPCFDLILLPLDIPDSVLDDPKVRELEFMAIELIAVANDIISFNVEHARGDIHNMVIVFMTVHNISVQEAMDRAGKWYHQRAQEFLSAMYDLPTADSKKAQVDLQRYVWGIGNWITANYEWSFESERFWNGMKLDEEMKYGHDVTIELMPRKEIAGTV